MKLALLLGVLACAGVAARSSKDDGVVYELLIFPQGCLGKFLSGDLLNMACIKPTLSKTLGYGIIAGSAIVKIPQVVAFILAGSVDGVSRPSTYIEALGYVLVSEYHLFMGNPWSAYGESIIVAVQSILILGMIWAYAWPGLLEVSAVLALLVAAVQGAYMSGVEGQQTVQQLTIVLFAAARGVQVWANFAQGSTGELAGATLFMNFAGSAARIFTSSQEVKEPIVMYSFIISTVLNGTLLFQWVYYNLQKRKQRSAATAAAAVAAADPQAAAPAAAGPTSTGSNAERSTRRRKAA